MADLAQQVTKDTLQLFVGHGAAFRHAAHHLELLAFDQLAKLSMYHAEPIYLEYCPSEPVASDQSRGSWRKIGGDWKIRLQG
ncbi:MAG: hypothetical protein MI923_17395, partial [Phycisphaerales bacterium]|nr:hypothetical protein [Phycisphaerales bacterium]